jgi:hypothetical protein
MIGSACEKLILRSIGKLGLASVILCTASISSAQDAASLRISHPADGAVVKPGENVPVTVTSSGMATFKTVGILGELGVVGVETSTPAQLLLNVPADTACRKYGFSAMGITTSGKEIDSTPIQIDVERSDLPTSLATDLPTLIFEKPGEYLGVQLFAKFSDGTVLDVNESSLVKFFSSNGNVATVKDYGTITAVKPGKADVTAIYTLGTQNVKLVIPVVVPVPILAPSLYSLDFSPQSVGTSSEAREVTFKNISNGPVNVTGVEVNGSFAESDNCVSSSPLEAGQSCVMKVTFAPESSGIEEGAISISDDFDSSPLLIPTKGVGTGTNHP